MKDPILQSIGLAVGYKNRIVVSGMDFSLFRGEVVSLLGPNGSGKSTALRTLLGLQPSLDGVVLLDGAPLESYSPLKRARIVGAALSDRPRPWGMTALELVEQGRFSRDRDEDRCVRAMEDMGAMELAGRQLTELSDGELQRVHVARALAQDPSLLILDEPTSFLDQPRRVEVLRRLRRLATERDISVLLSLHDLDLALSQSDRCLLIVDGVISVGSPEDLVLRGAFGDAYGQPRDWDPLERPEPDYPHTSITVELSCPDHLSCWVLRGLRRGGFALGSSCRRLNVSVDDGDILFRVDNEGTISEHGGLDSVIDALSGDRESPRCPR